MLAMEYGLPSPSLQVRPDVGRTDSDVTTAMERQKGARGKAKMLPDETKEGATRALYIIKFCAANGPEIKPPP